MTSLETVLIGSKSALLLGIVAEGVAWAVLFVILVEMAILKEVTRRLKSGNLWKALEAEKGVMGPNLALDVVQMVGFGLQHAVAGSMILYGSLYSNLALVRAGLLCEWGWETKDYINVISQTGPYREGHVSESFRASMKFHHLPGVILATPIIFLNLHANVHVQRIGAMMILVGGLGVLMNVVRLVLRVGLHAPKNLMNAFGVVDTLLCFGFVRFLVFPQEVLFLLRDLIASEYHILALAVFAGFTMMSKLNWTVFQLKLRKLRDEEDGASNATLPEKRLLKRQSSSFHPVVGDVD